MVPFWTLYRARTGFLIVELASTRVVKREMVRTNDQIVVVALRCVVDRTRILAVGRGSGGYAALAAPGVINPSI